MAYSCIFDYHIILFRSKENLFIARNIERFKTAPSQLLSDINGQIDLLEVMKTELQNVFYKSKPNQVQGKLTFANPLLVDQLQLGATDIKVCTTIVKFKYLISHYLQRY